MKTGKEMECLSILKEMYYTDQPSNYPLFPYQNVACK